MRMDVHFGETVEENAERLLGAPTISRAQFDATHLILLKRCNDLLLSPPPNVLAYVELLNRELFGARSERAPTPGAIRT